MTFKQELIQALYDECETIERSHNKMIYTERAIAIALENALMNIASRLQLNGVNEAPASVDHTSCHQQGY